MAQSVNHINEFISEQISLQKQFLILLGIGFAVFQTVIFFVIIKSSNDHSIYIAISLLCAVPFFATAYFVWRKTNRLQLDLLQPAIVEKVLAVKKITLLQHPSENGDDFKRIRFSDRSKLDVPISVSSRFYKAENYIVRKLSNSRLIVEVASISGKIIVKDQIIYNLG